MQTLADYLENHPTKKFIRGGVKKTGQEWFDIFNTDIEASAFDYLDSLIRIEKKAGSRFVTLYNDNYDCFQSFLRLTV